MSSSTRKGYMRGFLAGTAMIGFLAVFAFLAFRVIPAANKDFFNMSLVALIGLVGTAFGYYLGSSEGSAAKNDLLTPASVVPSAPVNKDEQAGFIRLPLLGFMAMALLLILAACSTSSVKTSAKSLLLTQRTVVAAAEAADSMCTQGSLTQDQCDEVAKLYAQAKDAYDVALVAEQAVIDAAIAGDDQSQDDARAAYSVALSGFTAVATKIVAFAAKYGLLEEK